MFNINNSAGGAARTVILILVRYAPHKEKLSSNPHDINKFVSSTFLFFIPRVPITQKTNLTLTLTLTLLTHKPLTGLADQVSQ